MKFAIRNPQSAIRNGFTLIELMVVIAIIILVAATAMPTLTSLFTAGQDQQAFNILSAQLSAARALAITEGTYAGVHVQMADNPDFYISYPNLPKCYTAILIYDSANQTFDLAPGYQPQPMPGSMAFGQISTNYIDTSSTPEEYDNLGDPSDWNDASKWTNSLAGFTTFTIVFNPQGEVVTNVEGGDVAFVAASSTGLFAAYNATSFTNTQLWRRPLDHSGTLAVTLFDGKVLQNMSESQRITYLNEFGQFLALNLYTGKFFARE